MSRDPFEFSQFNLVCATREIFAIRLVVNIATHRTCYIRRQLSEYALVRGSPLLNLRDDERGIFAERLHYGIASHYRITRSHLEYVTVKLRRIAFRIWVQRGLIQITERRDRT